MPSKDTTIIRSPISFKTYLQNLQKILFGETGYKLSLKEVQMFLEKKTKQSTITMNETKKIVLDVLKTRKI